MSPIRHFLAATLSKTKIHSTLTFTLVISTCLACFAQSQSASPADTSSTAAVASAAPAATAFTVPAGTTIALVLTHPIQSRLIHRGNLIYAQITSPVTSGNQVVVPAGTLVEGTVDSLGRKRQPWRTFSAIHVDRFCRRICRAGGGPHNDGKQSGLCAKGSGPRTRGRGNFRADSGIGLGRAHWPLGGQFSGQDAHLEYAARVRSRNVRMPHGQRHGAPRQRKRYRHRSGGWRRDWVGCGIIDRNQFASFFT